MPTYEADGETTEESVTVDDATTYTVQQDGSADDVFQAILGNNTYVNVHTDDGTPPPNTGAGDMQSGEIRGQIVAD